MEHELLLLCIAVFGASALQAATGIGFGVVAGGILLAVLNDTSAIQVSVVLNLLIAGVLAPALRKKADRKLLQHLVIGLLIGSPPGLMVYLYLDVVPLKIFAGLVVLFTLLMVLRGDRNAARPTKPGSDKTEQVLIGVVSGMMGSSLAMPGPVPAAWMSVRGFDKNTIRATILMMFVIAYAVALLLQITIAGITAETARQCAILAPATLVGTGAGNVLSTRVSQKTFRVILIVILAATAATLFSSLR
jgi:uncharacterized membrane protein YfcA